MLSVGTKAPEFSLRDQSGEVHNLEQYKGKKVILYFYPKDNTSGCSKQADGFGKLYSEFQLKNTIVLGVSKDSVKSHENFSKKYELPFPILSDENLECIKAYDVWHEKKNYGKTYMGVVRTTYLIDENGIIEYASDKVRAAKNPEEMLEKL